MNYGAIKYCDIANGTGVRTNLFVSGCTHHCKGCLQPENWAFDYGEPYTQEIEDKIIESLEPDYIEGLTILGGEPMEPINQVEIVKLIRRVKSELNNKSVWIYTGYTYETDLADANGKAHCNVTDEILDLADVLVDGEFVEELKDISLLFRGSSNQRILNLKEIRGQSRNG